MANINHWEHEVEKILLGEKKDILTPFLSPEEIINITNKISKNYKINKDYGFIEGERGRLYISKGDRKKVDYNILILELTWRNCKLTHRDFLGSVLGLGIARQMIGDIQVGDNRARIAVDKTIGQYLLNTLVKVGSEKVDIEITEDKKIEDSKILEVSLNVTSMRIDSIIAKSLNISRDSAKTLISEKKVSVNYLIVKKSTSLLKENDLISCRGFGRIKVLSGFTETKKGKIKIKIGKYI